MGAIGLTEWLTLAGLMVTIGSAFAIPLAIWMAKMWSSTKITHIRLKSLSWRIRRLETTKPAELVTAMSSVATLANTVSTLNDRVNEHAEHLAVHETRINSNDAEIKNLREKQHNLSNRMTATEGEQS